MTTSDFLTHQRRYVIYIMLSIIHIAFIKDTSVPGTKRTLESPSPSMARRGQKPTSTPIVTQLQLLGKKLESEWSRDRMTPLGTIIARELGGSFSDGNPSVSVRQGRKLEEFILQVIDNGNGLSFR